MFKNYLKTTLRSLQKNKAYSFLNIFGLAIGIACAALIFLWAEDELTYDKVHVKKDRLYAVRAHHNYQTRTLTHWSTPGLLGPAIQTEIPGIASTCRKSEGSMSRLFSMDDKSMYARGCFAEPSIFSMLTLPFVQGNAKTAFDQLYSIVITEETAKKFFGNEHNVIGKKVRMDNRQDYIVTGVMKDIPTNSSLRFEWIAPFEIYYQESDWVREWENFSVTTYVELQPAASLQNVNKQLYNYIQKRDPASIAHLFLFSMNDWRLYDDFENGVQTGKGRITFVQLFTIIAWIILFIACINFMNLATARSEKRAKEVGVRKVLGAQKKTLAMQFIGEAFLMAVLSAIVAVVIISLTLPLFNTLVQKELSPGFDNPLHIAALVLITLICGLVAGSYPSLYLSSFNPVFVLKGVKLKTAGASFIRKGLVVLQFSVSIILIVGTIIIYQQIQHVKHRDLGFNKDNLIEMNMQGDMIRHFDVIKQDLINTGLVENVAVSDHATIYGGNNTDDITWNGKPAGTKILISTRNVSPEFMAVSGIKVKEGRDFRSTDQVDYSVKGLTQLNVVITESLAKLMGNESAVGKLLYYEGDTSIKATIVGVVSDYVYGNMYGKPDPVVFIAIPPKHSSVMYVRTKAGGKPEQALAKMEAVMKKNNPLYPFEYRFVDDQFNRLFTSEQLISKLSRVFSALAIIISCLGLFGLAAYTAERRTKEIGIRKVLGASVSGITRLLSKDFLKLIALAAIVAFPVSWWVMNNWLQNYQYRITISAWVFVIAAALALLIALLTISFQSIKAAMANPVKSLRSE